MTETTGDEERENPGGVLGVGLGLLLFALATMWVLMLRTRTLDDPASVWREHFSTESPPEDFAFERASELAGSRVLLSLVRAQADPSPLGAAQSLGVIDPEGTSDPSGAESVQGEGGEGDQGSEGGWIDWSGVEVGPIGELPERLVFLFYPRSASEEMFSTYFQDLPRENLLEMGSEGGTLIIESGNLDWNGYSTNYVHQRNFQVEEGVPGFVDSLRVNLSVGQSCVMLAIWPRSSPASSEVVEALLAEVRASVAPVDSD